MRMDDKYCSFKTYGLCISLIVSSVLAIIPFLIFLAFLFLYDKKLKFIFCRLHLFTILITVIYIIFFGIFIKYFSEVDNKVYKYEFGIRHFLGSTKISDQIYLVRYSTKQECLTETNNCTKIVGHFNNTEECKKIPGTTCYIPFQLCCSNEYLKKSNSGQWYGLGFITVANFIIFIALVYNFYKYNFYNNLRKNYKICFEYYLQKIKLLFNSDKNYLNKDDFCICGHKIEDKEENQKKYKITNVEIYSDKIKYINDYLQKIIDVNINKNFKDIDDVCEKCNTIIFENYHHCCLCTELYPKNNKIIHQCNISNKIIELKDDKPICLEIQEPGEKWIYDFKKCGNCESISLINIEIIPIDDLKNYYSIQNYDSLFIDCYYNQTNIYSDIYIENTNSYNIKNKTIKTFYLKNGNISINKYCFNCESEFDPQLVHCCKCKISFDNNKKHCCECKTIYIHSENHCNYCHKNFNFNHCEKCHINYNPPNKCNCSNENNSLKEILDRKNISLQKCVLCEKNKINLNPIPCNNNIKICKVCIEKWDKECPFCRSCDYKKFRENILVQEIL